MITTYSNINNKVTVDIEYKKLIDFIDSPSLPKLINILRGKDESIKRAVLTSLNCNINYSSIKPFIKNDVILYNLLKDIELVPVHNTNEIRVIMEYINSKSNTSIVAKNQANSVAQFFNRCGYPNTISSTGSTDIEFKNRKAAAKSDGIVIINDIEVLIYMRYGTSSGGAQNDRWRGMFSIASRHKDSLFLFVVDGVEALQQYPLCTDEFAKDDYPNAIWSTVKYLNFINFDDLRIK